MTDHPRIRGEHSFFRQIPGETLGSSPHTRGAQVPVSLLQRGARIIPAYAGSTVNFSGVSFTWWDHPRIRGEHISTSHRPGIASGSSPHTRGARNRAENDDIGPGIIPAYAGSTPHGIIWIDWMPDHPRIRGEHSGLARVDPQGEGSSPHTRGAPAPGFSIRPGAGIIPAYAGSTRLWRPCRRRPWDHPRIRGEHARPTARRVDHLGSSPHTRGAQEASEFRFRDLGIIPAYAGSTDMHGGYA